MGSKADADPFAIFLTPPPNETAGERAAREAREAEAKRISDEIDDQLRQDKAALKKRKSVVRVLLLGQSESGKSTTLKNFRMKYARNDWENERASWRAVIQLNLVRSIITIIETLQAEMDGDPLDAPMTPVTPVTPSSPLAGPSNGPVPPLPTSTPFHLNGYSDNTSTQVDPQSPLATANSIGPVSPNISGSFAPLNAGINTSSAVAPTGRRPTIDTSNLAKLPLSSLLTDKHEELKRRLGPLRRVEADLRARLGTGADEDRDGAAAGRDELGVGELDPDALKSVGLSVDDNGVVLATGSGAAVPPPLPTTTTTTVTRHGVIKREFSVRRLKDALENGKRTSMTSLRGQAASTKKTSGSPDEPGSSEASADDEDVDPVTSVIVDCKNDMLALWTDEAVRVILKRRKVRMEESSGFFLDDLERIASHSYSPSDDDILRARLRTVGVQEYKIYFENESLFNDFGREWLLYDVGGSRTMRHAWIPFFEGITSILFMAPVSCFDERLSEDSRINRLEDSFLLWRTICGSKLLAKTSIILFLNKCDLLKRKLKTGVKVRNYLPSFADRSNDVNTVVKYLREKFREILKQYSPEPRSSYFYATSVVDTRATSTTIKAVKDSILRDFLKSADLV